MKNELHDIQGAILKGLLLRESARFSDLQPENIPSDQFTFHIKQLMEQGIVMKRDDGLYELTTPGKEYANRFDIDSTMVKHEVQAKIGALVIASRKRDGKMEYVMQERLKHPFFGFRGFITGKIKVGETVLDAAARELEEETGLKGDMQLKTIAHERIYSPTKQLLEDKYFFICTVSNPRGDLIQHIEGGKNAWIPEEDVLKGNIFYEIADLLELAKGNSGPFSEKSYTVEKY